MEFEELDKGEHVFAVEEDAKLYGNQPDKIHKTGELLRFALKQCGAVIGSGGWLTDAGVRGQLLKIGSPGWVAGKIRFRVVMEFCPDEPEPKPSIPPKSGLEEFRQ